VRFGLVIFDNDGVLVDSEPIACDVLAVLLTSFGLPTSFDDVVREYLGGSLSRTRQIAESRIGTSLPGDFERRFHEQLFRRFDSELHPVQGVEQFIDTLQVPFCVASSGTHERIRRSLQSAGLLHRFDGSIFSAVDVAAGKPAPDLFLLAAQTMGFESHECVVIEDSPIGLEAALRAGMDSVGYAGLHPPAKLSDASLGVIQSFDTLGALLS
jgi:HAD superfamily hydrolase (TIGR01509 family)